LALGNCKFCETAIHADQQLWKDPLDGFAQTLMFTLIPLGRANTIIGEISCGCWKTHFCKNRENKIASGCLI